jgi:hypothetical protein
MNVFKSILFISLIFQTLQAQKDSLAYGSLGFQLNEGFYLSINDLKQNKPIGKNQISSKENQQALDYFSQVVKNYDTLYIKNNSGKTSKVSLDSTWGYCQNNQIYIRYDKEFFKVPLFGNISSYLIFLKQTTPRTYNPWMYDPYFNNAYGGYGSVNNNASTTTVSVQMILDLQSGSIDEFSVAALENILKRDESIFKEYNGLKKKKKREKAIYYLRKYNMMHPVYFPKN